MQAYFFLLAVLTRQAVCFSLYAYGRTIPGLSVFYDDGLAYIGYTNGSLDSTATNVSCTLTDGTVTVSPNTTTDPSTSWSSQKLLYIAPSNSSISQAGFVDSNTTASNAITDGWLFYGRQLANTAASSDGALLSSFWAIETNTTGLWTLNWNSGGNDFGNGLPVAVKTAPPPPRNSSPSSRRRRIF